MVDDSQRIVADQEIAVEKRPCRRPVSRATSIVAATGMHDGGAHKKGAAEAAPDNIDDELRLETDAGEHQVLTRADVIGIPRRPLSYERG